jgi:hypothetical protein
MPPIFRYGGIKTTNFNYMYIFEKVWTLPENHIHISNVSIIPVQSLENGSLEVWVVLIYI